VIRNACIHLNGEQPLLADLFDLPASSDVTLSCTNLRNMNGKRPVFADDSAAVFYFPMIHIRFIEIPPKSVAGTDLALDLPVPVGVHAQLPDGLGTPESDLDEDLEIDEDFLRRVREA
jgi:hypothetical protein